MKRDQILEVLKQYKKRTGDKYGVVKIGIFGSVAREKPHEQSDLDIVVDLREQDLFNLIGIKQDLEESLHAEIDIVSYRPGMNPFLKKRIDQEAVYV